MTVRAENPKIPKIFPAFFRFFDTASAVPKKQLKSGVFNPWGTSSNGLESFHAFVRPLLVIGVTSLVRIGVTHIINMFADSLQTWILNRITHTAGQELAVSGISPEGQKKILAYLASVFSEN